MTTTNDNGWFVYMIRCNDDSLYTGITTDMARRWREHSQPISSTPLTDRVRVSDTERVSGSVSERSRTDQQRSGRCKEEVCEVANTLREVARKPNRGAKFFRTRKPVQLAYIESGHDRSSASRREAAIKRLARPAKLQLLTTEHNELHTLDRALLPMLDS